MIDLLQFKVESSKIFPEFIFFLEELKIDGSPVDETPSLGNFNAMFEKEF